MISVPMWAFLMVVLLRFTINRTSTAKKRRSFEGAKEMLESFELFEPKNLVQFLEFPRCEEIQLETPASIRK